MLIRFEPRTETSYTLLYSTSNGARPRIRVPEILQRGKLRSVSICKSPARCSFIVSTSTRVSNLSYGVAVLSISHKMFLSYLLRPSINAGIFVSRHLRLLRDGGCFFSSWTTDDTRRRIAFIFPKLAPEEAITSISASDFDLGLELASLPFRKKEKEEILEKCISPEKV